MIETSINTYAWRADGAYTTFSDDHPHRNDFRPITPPTPLDMREMVFGTNANAQPLSNSVFYVENCDLSDGFHLVIISGDDFRPPVDPLLSLAREALLAMKDRPAPDAKWIEKIAMQITDASD